MKRLLTFVLVIVAGAYLLQLWPEWTDTKPRKVSIQALSTEPELFDGKRVRVTGTVQGKISLVGMSAFIIEDEQGYTLDVAGFARPEPGDTITLTGNFKVVSLPGGIELPVLYVN